jgi:hypothetical protein
MTRLGDDNVVRRRFLVDMFIIDRLDAFIEGILEVYIVRERPVEYRDFNGFHLSLDRRMRI